MDRGHQTAPQLGNRGVLHENPSQLEFSPCLSHHTPSLILSSVPESHQTSPHFSSLHLSSSFCSVKCTSLLHAFPHWPSNSQKNTVHLLACFPFQRGFHALFSIHRTIQDKRIHIYIKIGIKYILEKTSRHK